MRRLETEFRHTMRYISAKGAVHGIVKGFQSATGLVQRIRRPESAKMVDVAV